MSQRKSNEGKKPVREVQKGDERHRVSKIKSNTGKQVPLAGQASSKQPSGSGSGRVGKAHHQRQRQNITPQQRSDYELRQGKKCSNPKCERKSMELGIREFVLEGSSELDAWCSQCRQRDGATRQRSSRLYPQSSSNLLAHSGSTAWGPAAIPHSAASGHFVAPTSNSGPSQGQQTQGLPPYAAGNAMPGPYGGAAGATSSGGAPTNENPRYRYDPVHDRTPRNPYSPFTGGMTVPQIPYHQSETPVASSSGFRPDARIMDPSTMNQHPYLGSGFVDHLEHIMGGSPSVRKY